MITLLLLVFIPMAGCQKEDEPPEELISEDVYRDLLMETVMTGYYIQLMGIEDQRDSLFAVLFDEYGVTQAAYDSSHAWYHRDVEAQTQRIESIREELNEEARRLENAVQTTDPE